MEKKRVFVLLSLVVSLVVTTVFAVIASAAEVPRMEKEALKAQLSKPDLIILDVRREADWTSSDYKIKGAIREDPDQPGSWAEQYPKDKTVVLYCA